MVAGGRSSGARVACRTAAETGAIGVLCLAFPVHPPGRPEKSRLDELDAVGVPVLVVQGDRDPFGMPPDGPDRTVAVIAGDHGLKSDRRGAGGRRARLAPARRRRRPRLAVSPGQVAPSAAAFRNVNCGIEGAGFGRAGGTGARQRRSGRAPDGSADVDGA